MQQQQQREKYIHFDITHSKFLKLNVSVTHKLKVTRYTRVTHISELIITFNEGNSQINLQLHTKLSNFPEFKALLLCVLRNIITTLVF